ncbi:hypothetical protein VE01_08806 [Pseudogymnoascus verrucosus]|uniref:Aminoglycoside phosphotransferase domain-containing protein n=1 Tax=Pseudogymnoascus verrucosus TaxID=342668 RepID=A0A1B8GC69_9PEZI|nr:uncharacterized protein VE01_08806 [Pseudogymnoascus verrucosus]OBT93410.1 hypothetical protein VE01_08806 [Pseudogymnoascus verrucosus]
MAPTPPPSSVLTAFSLTTPPTPLPGGQNTSFLSGTTVLKHIPPTPTSEAEWTSHTLSLLPPSPHFTIPTPLLASTGSYVHENWTATTFYPGTAHPVGHWDALFSAARHFHASLDGIPRPDFLRKRTHPWARADGVAWGEESVDIVPALAPLYSRLVSLRKEVGVVIAQLVHGDLSGNILFSDDKPPVIIDFSPFYRCVDYAVAIAVVDGIADFGEGEEEVLGASGLGTGRHAVQMLVRALLFRVVARSELVGVMGEVGAREMRGFERVMGVIEKYV